MGIGTSLGAYFENDFTHQAGIEDHTHDEMVVSPDKVDQNKQLEKVDNDELGGIEISKKDKMPFPDNRNPDTDFNSRFGNLPPSGILNDLKPQDRTPPLVRKIGFKKDEPEPEPQDVNHGPDPIQQFMAGRGSRQPSTIVSPPPLTATADPAPQGADENSTDYALRVIGHVLDHPEWSPAATQRVQGAHSSVSQLNADFEQEPFNHERTYPTAGEGYHPMDPIAASNHYHYLANANAQGAAIRFAHEYEETASPEQWIAYEDHVNNLANHPESQRREMDEMVSGERDVNENDAYGGSHPMSPEVAWKYYNSLPERQASSFNADYAGRANTPQYRRYLRGFGNPEPDPETYDREVSAYKAEKEERKSKQVADYKSLDAPEIKTGSIAMKPEHEGGRQTDFNFYHEPTGTIGSMSISLRNEGKQIYVHGLALDDGIEPNSLGKRAMRDMIEALKEKYPNAETIKGFRVSGARAATGKGSADAEMRIRPAKEDEDIYKNGPLGDTNAHRF